MAAAETASSAAKRKDAGVPLDAEQSEAKGSKGAPVRAPKPDLGPFEGMDDDTKELLNRRPGEVVENEPQRGALLLSKKRKLWTNTHLAVHCYNMNRLHEHREGFICMHNGLPHPVESSDVIPTTIDIWKMLSAGEIRRRIEFKQSFAGILENYIHVELRKHGYRVLTSGAEQFKDAGNTLSSDYVYVLYGKQ